MKNAKLVDLIQRAFSIYPGPHKNLAVFLGVSGIFYLENLPNGMD